MFSLGVGLVDEEQYSGSQHIQILNHLIFSYGVTYNQKFMSIDHKINKI